jgi:hypothetical protein
VLSSGLRESPRDGGLDGSLGHLERKQAQAFATPLAMSPHPQRAGEILPPTIRHFAATQSEVIGCDKSALAMACLAA